MRLMSVGLVLCSQGPASISTSSSDLSRDEPLVAPIACSLSDLSFGLVSEFGLPTDNFIGQD